MAFRFPPPPTEEVTPSFTPVMNFNIPPPGFRPYMNEVRKQDTYFNHPQSQIQTSEDISRRNTSELLRESDFPAEETPNITKYLHDLLEKRKHHSVNYNEG